MVRVSWESKTGRLIDVRPGDGPGKYSDGVNAEKVESRLSNVGQISEAAIAASVESVYQETDPNVKKVVTTETYSEPGVRGVSTTLAFIEIADLIDRLEQIECTNCFYKPEGHVEWNSRERKGARLDYKDWLCPECDSIVHTEAYATS